MTADPGSVSFSLVLFTQRTQHGQQNHGRRRGNVGATTAQRVAEKELARTVVMVDVVEGVPQGKGLDQWQSRSIEGFDSRIIGTNGYDETAAPTSSIITAASRASRACRATICSTRTPASSSRSPSR
jgi:hypothetical protein